MRPPFEAGLTLDVLAVGVQGDTLPGDGGVEIIERFEVAVDDGFVQVNPEGFGWLQFGAVGRQVDETDAVGNGDGLRMPSRIVEDEDDPAFRSGCRLFGKQGEHRFEERLVDTV